MGILGDLVGGATLGGVKGVFEGIGSLAKDLRSAFTGEISVEKKAELLAKTVELEGMANLGQLEVNKQEAAHRSIFVAGWRPAIGWVGAVSLACYFIPQYLMASVLWAKTCWGAQAISSFPISEPGGLIQLVSLMLGVGILRTVEKLKGASQ